MFASFQRFERCCKALVESHPIDEVSQCRLAVKSLIRALFRVNVGRLLSGELVYNLNSLFC